MFSNFRIAEMVKETENGVDVEQLIEQRRQQRKALLEVLYSLDIVILRPNLIIRFAYRDSLLKAK